MGIANVTWYILILWSMYVLGFKSEGLNPEHGGDEIDAKV